MKDENYWSLVVEPGYVQAGIWKLQESSIDIYGVGKHRKWDDHEILEVTDAALSDAVKNFPEEEKDPSKTIFGVPPSWVENGSIKKEYLEKIRKICIDLSLSPSGFVVLPEAISHSVKIQEGSPLSGIVVGVGEKLIDVTLFKLGNLVGTVNVGKSVSVVDDIVEGLVRFATKDSLPTRIILYGSDEKEIEDLKQEMINTEWSEKAQGKVKFIHVPQIEVLSSKQKVIATSIAGASEMTDIEKVTLEGKPLSTETDSQEADVDNVAPSGDLTAEDIGFVIDEDITEKQQEDDQPKFAGANITNEQAEQKKFSLPTFSSLFKKKSKKQKEVETLKKLGSPPASPIKKIAISMVVLLIIFVISITAAWWYLPEAEVAIFVSPKRLEEQQAIVLDENIDSSAEGEDTYPIQRVSVQVNGDTSKQTTGTQTVGERASGTVTIRNGTAQSIQFEAGTSLLGPNDLEFSINESASVSAALSPTEPGSVTVPATASDIGADYNLASNESMSVGNYPTSEVDAIVTESFSGGSSSEIVAVSQADLNALEETLEEELRTKGISDLETKIGDMRFIPDSVTVEIGSQDFSNAVGDEASTVSLSMAVEVTGLAISQETMNSLAERLLSDQVPDGFNLKTEQINVIFDLVEEAGGGLYEFDVSLEANLLPEVNIDEIKDNVVGKYPPQAKSYLSTIPGYSSAEVLISPRFPGRLGIIPFSKDKVSVEIVAER